MKNKDIFKKLNAEFDRITPEMSDKVKNEPIRVAEKETAEERVYASAGEGGGNVPIYRRPKVLIAAAAALVVLALALTFAFIPLVRKSKTTYLMSDSYITMTTADAGVSLQSNVKGKNNLSPRAAGGPADISFSIVSDSEGKVVKVIGGNRESEIVLAGLSASQSISGMSVDEAVNALSTATGALGYYTADRALRFSTISARGEQVATDIAANIKTEAESALAGATVVSVVSDKAALQASLGVTGEYSLEELLALAAKQEGYLEETAHHLYQSGGGALYNAYLFELLEEYIDLLEDRQEAFAELYEVYDEIKGELGWFSEEVLIDGMLNPDIDLDRGLKEDFNDALSECAETLLVPQTDDELKLLYRFYSALDFDLLEDILEKFEDTVVKISDVYEEIKTAVSGLVGEWKDMFDKIGAEWEELSGGVGASGFSDPEDYIEQMTKRFEREFEKLMGR